MYSHIAEQLSTQTQPLSNRNARCVRNRIKR